MSKPRLELVGRAFGRLVVVSFDSIKHGTRWLCACSCGSSSVVEGSKLVAGKTNSCGCLMREKQKQLRPSTRHGHSPMGRPSATYKSWYAMAQRCTNLKNINFPGYGGRGIAVCERWRVFANFLTDMGPRPDGTSIDRIDNDGNYEPSNCRWATQAEQSQNTRRTKLSRDDAQEILGRIEHGESPASAARRFGISASYAIQIRNGKYWRDLPPIAHAIRSTP